MGKHKSAILVAALFLCLATEARGAGKLEELFTKGQEAYQNRDYRKALQYFEKAVELDPNFAPVYNALGLCHYDLKDKLSDVAWFFKVAVDIDPRYSEAYNNLCKVYYDYGEYNEAEKSCLKALEISPSLGSAQLSLAWVYLLGKSQPNDAINYFSQVLEKVKAPMVYYGLGMAYSKKGDNARVLDIVTILKGMNESELADQLERMIRTPDGSMPSAAQASAPEKQEGMVVPAQGTLDPKPSAQDDSAPISGQMRVRLRGTLTNTNNAQVSPGAQEPQRHPGSLSP